MKVLALWLPLALVACSSASTDKGNTQSSLATNTTGGQGGSPGASGQGGAAGQIAAGSPGQGAAGQASGGQGTSGQGTGGQGTSGQGGAGSESAQGTWGCTDVERPNPLMAGCGGDTYVWSEGESLYRCVPVGFAVLDPVKGCVYQPSRPLTCVSARIGPGEMVCNNGVLYPDGTLGFVSFTNTNCPLFDLPSGAVEQPNANPDKYPTCATP